MGHLQQHTASVSCVMQHMAVRDAVCTKTLTALAAHTQAPRGQGCREVATCCSFRVFDPPAVQIEGLPNKFNCCTTYICMSCTGRRSAYLVDRSPLLPGGARLPSHHMRVLSVWDPIHGCS